MLLWLACVFYRAVSSDAVVVGVFSLFCVPRIANEFYFYFNFFFNFHNKLEIRVKVCVCRFLRNINFYLRQVRERAVAGIRTLRLCD